MFFNALMADQRLPCVLRGSSPDRVAGISQEGLYGDINDEWGISPHHFQIIPPSRDEATKGGRGLRQMRSMPFPSREGWATVDDIPPAVPTTQPPPASRHIRKTSKVAQILGTAGALAKTKEGIHGTDPLSDLMSPPIIPMEVDPFSGGPPGATIIGNRPPAGQTQVIHPPAPQHVFRPMSSMPSLLVATERHAAHTDISYSTGSSDVESAARRVPRPPHGRGHTEVGTLSTRSRSNRPPPPSVPGHYASSSQPLHSSRVVNVERKKSRRDLVYTHASHGGSSAAAPNLRKTRSSVVLSNTSSFPLHAPKPLRVSERPSAEALHLLVESRSAKPSHSKVQSGIATTHAVWPPAPVLRPQRIVMPPRTEREAYQAGAMEADKVSRKLSDERALVERVRHERDREARGQARDSRRHRERHHRRAETEGSRRYRQEVENRAVTGYEYPTVPVRVGAVW